MSDLSYKSISKRYGKSFPVVLIVGNVATVVSWAINVSVFTNPENKSTVIDFPNLYMVLKSSHVLLNHGTNCQTQKY